MTVCNTPANVTGCFALVNTFLNTWINCESCVCMQRLNTACPEPLSLAICQVKKDLNHDMKAKCFSKIPGAVLVISPLFFILFCLLALVICKKMYSLSKSKPDSSELLTKLTDSSTL